jgi:hypothetical protein
MLRVDVLQSLAFIQSLGEGTVTLPDEPATSHRLHDKENRPRIQVGRRPKAWRPIGPIVGLFVVPRVPC